MMLSASYRIHERLKIPNPSLSATSEPISDNHPSGGAASAVCRYTDPQLHGCGSRGGLGDRGNRHPTLKVTVERLGKSAEGATADSSALAEDTGVDSGQGSAGILEALGILGMCSLQLAIPKGAVVSESLSPPLSPDAMPSMGIPPLQSLAMPCVVV